MSWNSPLKLKKDGHDGWPPQKPVARHSSLPRKAKSTASHPRSEDLVNVTQLFFILLMAAVVQSCAHSRDVRPGPEGVNSVVVRASTEEDAERGALSQAEHFCGKTKTKPRVVDDKGTVYNGQMDESTRKLVRSGSQAVWMMGSSDPTSSRSVLGQAGQAGMVMTSGDDYRAEMKFRCQ